MILIVALVIIAAVIIGVICFMPLSKQRADRIVRESWENRHDTELTGDIYESKYQLAFIQSIENIGEFEIVSIIRERELYILSYKIHSIELTSALNTYIAEHGMEDIDIYSADQIITEMVESSPERIWDAKVYISRNGFQYDVAFSEEFVNAMYGGIISYYYDTIQNSYFYFDEIGGNAE